RGRTESWAGSHALTRRQRKPRAAGCVSWPAAAQPRAGSLDGADLGCKAGVKASATHAAQGHPGYAYYACPHNPANPRHTAQAPDHPRTVRVREDDLLQVVREFLATRVFGPDRAAMLAARLPATAAEDAARREQETATLRKRLRKIDAAENAHAREIGHLASLPQTHPQLPRCGPGSSNDSATWKPNARRSTTGSPPWSAPAPPATTRHSWTPCPCSATSSPMPPPASRPACSPHWPRADLQTNKTTRSASTPPSPPAPWPPWPTSSQAASSSPHRPAQPNWAIPCNTPDRDG